MHTSPLLILFVLQYLRYILSSYDETDGFALMDSMPGNCRACKSGSRILIEKAVHAPTFLQLIDEHDYFFVRQCIIIPWILTGH